MTNVRISCLIERESKGNVWRLTNLRIISVVRNVTDTRLPCREDRLRTGGFTLVELLVVVAILGILMSMLLSSIHRAKEKGRETQCMNNLRQIGIGIKMYYDDNRQMIVAPFGGIDSLPGCLATNHGPATSRNLYPYLGKSEVFHCPLDQGKFSEDCYLHPKTSLLPSCWKTRGYSYEFNDGAPIGPKSPYRGTLHRVAGSLLGRQESWIPNPVKFILMHEPPAAPQVCYHNQIHFEPRWYQWHRNRGKTQFLNPRKAPLNFYSSTLFADLHVGFFNFSKSLTTDPDHPYEETKDWMWYVALPDEPYKDRNPLR